MTSLALDDGWIAAHADRIVAALGSSSLLLELGCGAGRDTAKLCELARVVATDLSQRALVSCAQAVPSALPVRLDLARPLPFRDRSFGVVLASLSLHYFDWTTSLKIAADVRRCLVPGGLLIARLNSTNDVHHGAGSTESIERNFHRVGSATKRFFDEPAVIELFQGWKIERLEERSIARYENPKWVWEVVLRGA